MPASDVSVWHTSFVRSFTAPPARDPWPGRPMVPESLPDCIYATEGGSDVLESLRGSIAQGYCGSIRRRLKEAFMKYSVRFTSVAVALAMTTAMTPSASAQSQPANTGTPAQAQQQPKTQTNQNQHTRAKGAAAGAAIGAVGGNAGAGAAVGAVVGGSQNRQWCRQFRRGNQ